MGWTLALLLAAATIAIHYEFIRWLASHLPKLTPSRRRRIFLALTILFVAHVVEVFLFAGGYYIGAHWLELGSLAGAVTGDFTDYTYFSVATYTTVGYGDVFATDRLRAVAGMEALIGLLMITWSGAFTIFFMERHWACEEQ